MNPLIFLLSEGQIFFPGLVNKGPGRSSGYTGSVDELGNPVEGIPSPKPISGQSGGGGSVEEEIDFEAGFDFGVTGAPSTEVVIAGEIDFTTGFEDSQVDVGRTRTKLSQSEESKFQRWYKGWADKAGIDPNPDNPLHKYDYRGAYKAGVEPEVSPEDGLYHWPSEFKDEDHPNRYVKGIDTKTGLPVDTGRKLDKYGIPITEMRAGSFNYSLLEKARNKVRSMLGTEPWDESEEGREARAIAGAHELVKIMANEEGIPVSEYRQSPEFIEQASRGFVNMASFGVLPAIHETMTGEEDYEATNFPGYAGYALGSLGGLILGPFKVAEVVTAPLFGKYVPNVIKGGSEFIPGLIPRATQESRMLYRLATEGIKDASTIGLGMGMSSTGEALQQPTFREAADVIIDNTKSGTMTGAIFGVTRGLFPKKGWQDAARMITGMTALTAQRSYEAGGNPYVDRPWNEVLFDIAMDVYFLHRGLPPKKFNQLSRRINLISKKSNSPTEVDINVKEVDKKVENKIKKPPKPKADPKAEKEPTDQDPDYTFRSKKGNEYRKYGDTWFNNKGKVTNEYVIDAAEAKKTEYKSKADEDAASDQLIKELEDRYKKDIDSITDQEIEDYIVEKETKKEEPEVEVEEADLIEEVLAKEEAELEINPDEFAGVDKLDWFGEERSEEDIKALEIEPEIETTEQGFRQTDPKVTERNLKTMKSYDRIDNPDSLIGRMEAEVNGWLDGKDIDIATTRKLISDLTDHSSEWAKGNEVPPGMFGEMSMSEIINFSEYMKGLDEWVNRVKRSEAGTGVRLNMMIPWDEVPKLVRNVLDVARKTGTKIQQSRLYRNRAIWENTGMWLGRDEKWRFEIFEDKASFYVPKGTQKTFRIKDVLEYPELFQAVPEMRDVKVVLDKKLDAKGKFEKDVNTIFLRDRSDTGVFFHEVQHAVNEHTGSRFTGTSVEAQAELGKMENAIDRIYEVLGEVKTGGAKLYLRNIIKEMKYDIEKGKFSSANWEDRLPDNVYKTLKSFGEEIAAEKVVKPIEDIGDAISRYLKDPGEMEARVTEARFKMTPDERRAEAPWETLDKMLIKEGTGRRAGQKLYSIEAAAGEAAKQIFDKIVGFTKTKILSRSPKPFTIKEEAKELIIGRKSKLGSATYDTSEFVNSVEQRTTKDQRNAMVFVIEKTDVPEELNRPDLQKVLDKDRKYLEPIAEEIKDHFEAGFKKVKAALKDMSGKQIRDYVTHLWDIPRHKVNEATNWFLTQDRFMEKRFIDTYAEGIEMGFRPKTLDISEIIKIHDAVGNRAVENVGFIKELLNLEHEGVKLIHRGEGAPLDWIEVDYPALTRRIPLAKTTIKRKGEFVKESKVYAHPDLKRSLEVIFGSRFDSPVITAYEVLNAVMKKSLLSLNLFHHTELAKVAIAEIGFKKTADVYLNPVKIYKAMVRGELDIYKKHDIAKDAAEHTMQFGPSADIPIDRIQKWLNDLASKVEDKVIVGRLARLAAEMNSAWDKALWSYLHDTLKLHAYESAVGRLDANLDPEKLRKSKIEIAQRVNDIFGGQNWDILGLTPKEVQMMTWSLLSADWTASTIRQGLSLTGLGKVYKETGGLRAKGGQRFWLRAALYLGIGTNLLNAFFRDQDMKENPQYYQDKSEYSFLDKTMFWGNTIGNRTRLFVGRYDDGSERYLRWDKQFEDFFGLLYLPPEKKAQKIFGKAAPVPQALVEISPAGHTLSGFKNDDIYRRKGMDYVGGVVKRLGTSFLPLSTRRALQENIEWKPTDIFTQSSKGMSRFTAMEHFKRAIVTNDEDMLRDVYIGALRNNLPAFTLFNSSLNWVEAEATADLTKTTRNIKEVQAKLSVAETAFDKKRWGSKLAQLSKEKADKEAGIQLLNAALTKMEAYVDVSGIGEPAPQLPGRGGGFRFE